MSNHRPATDGSEDSRVSLKRSPSAAYVYPIKSLLSGRIQPAEDQLPNANLPYGNAPDVQASYGTSPLACPLLPSAKSWSPNDASIRSSQSDRNLHSPLSQSASPERLHRSRSSRSRGSYSPNFRHYPAGDSSVSPEPPRSFLDQHVDSCVPPFHPPQHQDDVSSDNANSPELAPRKFSVSQNHPLNPTDFVHLPPLNIPTFTQASSDDARLNRALAISREASSDSFLSAAGSRSGSTSNSEFFSGSSVVSEAGEHVSFRFEHMEDENGNHVIVGREGVLQKCEDEPICTPGSVQAFGVLIAVQETEETLVVRQVSENSTELLGLSPRHLFSLECFTDILPESQAIQLWEHIPYLTDPTDDDNSGLQVFLLSGWGAPGFGTSGPDLNRRSWTCWCALHRPTPTDPSSSLENLIIMEFELERDLTNPLYPPSGNSSPLSPLSSGSLVSEVDRQISTGAHAPRASTPSGLDGDDGWLPSPEDIKESTTAHSLSIPALERIRKMTISSPSSTPSSPLRRRSQRLHPPTGTTQPNIGMMDIFAVLSQINEQLGAVDSLEVFLKVVVGVIKDLTEFHRVMVYQFDESWNGQVVAELVDWTQTKDLYKGLHFPAADIPAQARALYAISRSRPTRFNLMVTDSADKVRILYNRSQSTARIVVKSKEDLEAPLDMSHCYLRAMSPIHIKYLANMGVQASMSISIMAFGSLWGLITCHSYGSHGMRVSFAVRQMLRLLSQSISRNIERLSYAQRLHTRKLINSMVSDRHTTGYIVSNTDDLLSLFDADSGILIIGEGAKIIGSNQHGQEILIMAEYLRLKKFNTIQVSQAVVEDFPDLNLTTGLQIMAGLLLVPLSSQGSDFIAFLRRGQPREVRWGGKPYKDGREYGHSLEPRKSFKTWSEVVAGRSRAWTDEQLETAGVLALVYGKFIAVWRQKESALQTTRLTEILLSNASHEVRTPLNHIINYLEMALDGPLDSDARENLSRSHAASKSLLFTINDLLDLTRLESGKETSFNEPFDLRRTIENATLLYRKEAERRNLEFRLELEDTPRTVVGDATKIQTLVQNLTANARASILEEQYLNNCSFASAVKNTTDGTITVSCTIFSEPEGTRTTNQTVVDIVVADTGSGMPPEKLEGIFRDFEQVGTLEPRSPGNAGLGLGLAVVARIVEQLGGQLRVDSKVGGGSRFSFLMPLAFSPSPVPPSLTLPTEPGDSRAIFLHPRRRSSSTSDDLDNFVEAMVGYSSGRSAASSQKRAEPAGATTPPIKAVKVDTFASEVMTMERRSQTYLPIITSSPPEVQTAEHPFLKVLIVEDNDVNRLILAKRLVLDHHTVITTTNGQEGYDKIFSDRGFDVVLMDLQMPILNGFEAAQKIRELERTSSLPLRRPAHRLTGRIPIFAVSASLAEKQHDELLQVGMDGWILKPIDFRRLGVIMKGVTDASQRNRDLYQVGCNWEAGGWLRK
ncbi:hypothetical protein DXG01_001335 [Tephrocybe rancida]|nr:hypothetical protein DXG01_001335 [Tephrocybe rancida]